ncbi:MAG: (Fe-S)-binding protein [Rhodospirillales bacterium]
MDGPSFTDVLKAQTDHILDACTRCGKCAEACPMTEPAGVDTSDSPALVGGVLDLLRGEQGTPSAQRWATVCSNSGKCIPACEYGINPRIMVNLARIATKLQQGEAAVRKAGNAYFNNMSRGTRTISRLQLTPDVLARLNPPLKPAGDYDGPPDIVFYTGCNIVKTPHIALLVLDVLDALNVTYEVMGGNSTCCGIQQFKQGDAKTAGRVGYNTIERLGRPGASRVLAWCPSCQIQIGEVALPAYKESFGETPFDMAPIAEFFAERLEDLRKLFVHPVRKKVALQERSALPRVMAAVKAVLRAIPELEVVELDVPIVSTQSVHLNAVPKFKKDLQQREFAAALAAGATVFASIFHGCHRDLVHYQNDVSFELMNFMELIGEAMGIHIPDVYKRLSLMGDVDAVMADTADAIAAHGMDPEAVRAVVAADMFGL